MDQAKSRAHQSRQSSQAKPKERRTKKGSKANSKKVEEKS